MTIYQEEMRRKANHHECEATYDESTGRLRITHDVQHLMDMDERGYLYYTTQDSRMRM